MVGEQSDDHGRGIDNIQGGGANMINTRILTLNAARLNKRNLSYGRQDVLMFTCAFLNVASTRGEAAFRHT
ncbi:hypothetical protein GCM10010082_18750 [Kushneria pakistanensis]|uniref:Uncharacterized protein n=1 Tax=Kushneria pakistanensis TaxID=1508770 RepID=A0ABQ3FJ49_9GAMM|nr:hypothetical protein GCM10010082_18750 [Kushneria pakistanensis]